MANYRMKKERNIICVVQARMGSTRLRNKMMLWLHGEPIAGWIFKRLSQSAYIDEIIFAIPETKENDPLESYLKGVNAKVYRGSEEDVLGRMCSAAEKVDATEFIRVCGDNPFVSGSEVDRLIVEHFSTKNDYTYNHIPRGNLYPDGLGAEIASMETVRELDARAVEKEDREHMFNYIWKNSNRYKIGTCNPESEQLCRPGLRLDIDTERDYIWMLNLKVQIENTAEEIVQCAGEELT